MTKIQKKDQGSQWYAEIYSELSALIDEKYIDYLENKKRPAHKKAAEARDIKKEKTFLNKKLKSKIELNINSYFILGIFFKLRKKGSSI